MFGQPHMAQDRPPFCARPDMSRIIEALPSIWAAMPSSAPMVKTPVRRRADGDVIGPLERGPREQARHFADVADFSRARLFSLPPSTGQRTGRSFQAGIILVAGRLD